VGPTHNAEIGAGEHKQEDKQKDRHAKHLEIGKGNIVSFGGNGGDIPLPLQRVVHPKSATSIL